MINVPIIHIAIPLIYVQMILLILLSFASIIFLFVTAVLLLDGVYRKNAQQYPKHFLWDFLVPIILLITPSILVISITKDHITLMEKFIIIICIHGFILVPLMNIWSQHRKWDSVNDVAADSWSHPRIFLRIAIAIIYPALFGFYYTILRYLRMGQTVDISQVLNLLDLESILSYIILSLFIWSFISIWARLLIWKILDLRQWLWKEFVILVTLINIFLLKFNVYFKIMDSLYKISYIWISYFIHDPIIYPKWPRSYFRNILFRIYRYPIILYVMIAFCCISEIFYFNWKFFYMLYFIMILLLLRPFIYFLNHFNGFENEWVQACCYADYINNYWNNPRYPERFWLSFYDIRQRLDNQPPISKSLDKHLKIKVHVIREDVVKNRQQIFNQAYTREKASRINFIKKGYHQWAQVRWVHTFKIIPVAEPIINKIWHPFTPYFAKTFYDYIALINNDWGHYKTIQQLEKKQKIPFPDNLYKNFPTVKTKTVSQALEENLITNFQSSKEFNIAIQTYNKHVKLDTAGQAEPDISYDMRNNTAFIDKRNHGLDQKSTQTPREIASNMFSNVSIDQYDQILTSFNQFLQLNFSNIEPNKMRLMQEGLINLKNSAHDFSKHQIVFAKIVHLYPDKGIPPLRLPHNFALTDLNDKSLDLLLKSNTKMKRVSDLLYIRKVSRHDDKQVLAIFEDSEMQRILAGNEI